MKKDRHVGLDGDLMATVCAVPAWGPSALTKEEAKIPPCHGKANDVRPQASIVWHVCHPGKLFLNGEAPVHSARQRDGCAPLPLPPPLPLDQSRRLTASVWAPDQLHPPRERPWSVVTATTPPQAGSVEHKTNFLSARTKKVLHCCPPSFAPNGNHRSPATDFLVPGTQPMSPEFEGWQHCCK